MLLVAAGQLDSATIEIDLAGTDATVRAVYHISRAPSDSVRFVLMRIAGQSVELIGATQPTLSGDEGAFAFTVPAASSGASTTVLEYTVSGDLTRIPIFVPNAPTDPGRGRVELRVRGYVHLDAVRDAFPRFSTVADAIVSRPENLPSFVLLPVGSGLSTNRAADALVAFLILLGTALWTLRHRRVRAQRQSLERNTP